MLNKIKPFLEESRQEFKRVNWPSRKETVHYTIFVIVLALGLAMFLGALDFIFVKVLQWFVL